MSQVSPVIKYRRVAILHFQEETLLKSMLAQLIMATTGQRDEKDAWQSLFSKDDRIGIKVNSFGGQGMSPDWSIIETIATSLKHHVGVALDQIIVFDRSSRELKAAGYPLQNQKDRIRCFGTDALPNGGYEHDLLPHRSIVSCFSAVVTSQIDALINLGVLKTHPIAGISMGMKNLYGLIHNPNRYHANGCYPYLADLLDHPLIQKKLKLNLCDAKIAQYEGESGDSAHIFSCGKLLASLDPVALDRVGLEIINAKRHQKGFHPIPMPSWLLRAQDLGLGVADLKRIDIVDISVP